MFKAEVHLNDNEDSIDYSVCSRITVENVDACIRKMHLHKAARPASVQCVPGRLAVLYKQLQQQKIMRKRSVDAVDTVASW